MEFYNSRISSDIRSMINYSQKRYFTSYSWTLRDPPSELQRFNVTFSDYDAVSEDEWTHIHATDYNTSYLIVPLSRFSEVVEVLPIGNQLSLRKVVNSLYEFYHQPLKQEDIDKIKNFPDTLGYVQELLKYYEDGKQMAYIDLRGDSIYFEGIERVKANVYKLNLGS